MEQDSVSAAGVSLIKELASSAYRSFSLKLNFPPLLLICRIGGCRILPNLSVNSVRFYFLCGQTSRFKVIICFLLFIDWWIAPSSSRNFIVKTAGTKRSKQSTYYKSRYQVREKENYNENCLRKN